MSFDNSRFTFDPFKNYAGVVMEQGRVQLDADWNEWLAELSRRIQAGTLDIFGHAVYTPTNLWAFLITATSGSPNTVSIGCGRMYVDGLLAENHGLHKNAVWDPALAELSGNPQPPNTSAPNPNPIDFTQQPYLPGAVTPTDTGSYLAYLDVWTRAITYLEDPHLIDKAVGVDTTGRLQTVWQVKLMPNTGGWNCQTPDSQMPYPASSAGLLTSGVQPNATAGPCCLASGAGYTGVENQFYRVEIHNPGAGNDSPTLKGATFKWSRDNASVETGVTAIQTVTNSVGNPGSQLTVLSLGRDQVLGFKNGDWIELLDDWSELWGNPGVICQIDSVNPSPCTITLTATVDTTAVPPGPGVAANFPVGANNLTDPKRRTRIRRWDQKAKVYDSHGNLWCDLATTGGLIPVPATKTLVLENGVTVQFGLSSSSGSFNVADYWTFAARTADGSVEKIKAVPPRGIHHHYAKLSVVTFSSPPSYPDCRIPWSTGNEGDCGCCSSTVGDNISTFGKYSTIQQAINSLPTTGPIVGGEVCILAGRYTEAFSIYNLSDVVIQGCGPQTCLASAPAHQPAAMKSKDAAAPPVTPESGLSAIITVVGSSNITLRSFTIEAADGEACILLDGKEVASKTRRPIKKGGHGPVETTRTYDTEFPSNITITDLSLTASTLPAIVAIESYILKIQKNRIAMEDTLSQWAALYVSGTEIQVEDNWIGLQDAANASDWMPSSVVADLPDGFNSANAPATALANGGIHIGGGSTDVYIRNNEIEGGSRNGITLGSYSIQLADGSTSGALTGLLPAMPDPAQSTYNLMLPGGVAINNTKGKLVAGSPLQDIQISNNRIRNSGLCGIGPVGFFNLAETIEVITIQNLIITGNTIEECLQDPLTPVVFEKTIFGYGAICVPDVQGLTIRDNFITDFGNVPGAQVCGIFVLNGEQVEISRNQVVETRDWTADSNSNGSTAGGAQAGVLLMYVSPPPLDQNGDASVWASMSALGGSSALPLYQPGLPALTMHNNLVRVPIGRALEVVGIGPFSIANNRLSTGGAISASSGDDGSQSGLGPYRGSQSFTGFLTASIVNLGFAIEIDAPGTNFLGAFNGGKPSDLQLADFALSESSSGAVEFTNNVCQLETRASGAQGSASVVVLTLDHLIFANNHLWLDGAQTAYFDALLLGATLQVNGNRMQESVGSVFGSGITFGVSNITTHNTCSFCLFAEGLPRLSILTPNVVFDRQFCKSDYGQPQGA